MAPLPIAWYQAARPSPAADRQCRASFFLELCGLAVYREGFRLHLPGYTAEVGEACSGLRQFDDDSGCWAVVVGHFASVRSWDRWTLALAAFPVAIAAELPAGDFSPAWSCSGWDRSGPTACCTPWRVWPR